MSKVVFWLVVVFAILFGLRLLNAAKAKKRGDDARRQEREKPPRVEETVRCSRCGVYLPKAEARFGPKGLTCGDPNCNKLR
jgi:hypothetical protein